MTQAHKTPGNLVEFKEECFSKDNWRYPHFELYKNHKFEVLDNPYPDHILIRCISGLKNDKEEPLQICIHDDEIKSLSPIMKKKFKR